MGKQEIYSYDKKNGMLICFAFNFIRVIDIYLLCRGIFLIWACGLFSL